MSNAYAPPGFSAPIDLDLSRNEGRVTVSELSLGEREVTELYSRYPDTSRLRRVIAERHGLPETQVLVTAGGDDALFRCFLSVGGGSVVATKPSFEMIRRYASQTRSPLVEIPWWDGDFPLGHFLGVEAELAVVVSPNNPTGSVIGPADLRKIAGEFPLVVLDAAYVEFAEEDLTVTALDLGNVVVVRTLSKAFGLAGLRVGYLLGPSDLVERISAFGSPYSLSSLSAALAGEVLSDSGDESGAFIAAIADERDLLAALLEELGCRPLPSQGNFVLATDVEPSWLVTAAASLGIGLRRFDDEMLASCVRIGLPGEPAGFSRLQRALRAVLAPEAILFDLDGVLADVRGSYRTAIVETAASFGVEVTDGDISAAKAAGDASDDWDLTRRLCVAQGVEVPFETVKTRFEEIYQGDGGTEGLKTTETLLVTMANLQKWARRLPLGVVTARPRSDAVEFLERFDIAGYFSAVVTREDAPSKPDPAPVRLAMERLGVS
ncbi:MAG: aminotransferase class I/II-fold pyridoxal phosphate-dependent enzyme, partial [Acidimicrobiia bacterium]